MQTRISLYEYGAAKHIRVCPLSVPWHPLEPASSSPTGIYWDLVRQTLTSMQLSIDDWLHVFWQELYSQCAPTITHQTVLLHQHIRSRRDFQEACATSSTTLRWCTGVLLSAQQLEEVMKVVLTDHNLHKGRVLISTQLQCSPQVQGMVSDSWRLSEAFPLQLHRVWKNTRHVPKQKVWVHMLEQDGGMTGLIRRGQRRTFAQVLRQSSNGAAIVPAQVEVPVWLRRWERGAPDGVPSELWPAHCSPVIGDHLQGPADAARLGQRQW